MRPSPTLQPLPELERFDKGRALNPASVFSLLLLGAIVVAGPCILGAVRPWIELPILGLATVLLLLQAGRLASPPPLGSLRQIDAIDISVLLFVAYAIIRWLTSPVEFLSRFEMLSIVGYAIVFLFCRYGIPRRTYGVVVIVLLAMLGLGEVIFGYLLHLHSNLGDPQSLWYPFGPAEQSQFVWAPRWVGTYGCPNNYGCLLVMATGAALALGCFSRFAWPARILFFYLSAVLLVGIVYSQSRGSWLSLVGAFAALIFFALRYSKLRWWIPLAGALILIAILSVIFNTSKVVEQRVHDVSETVEGGSLNRYMRVALTEDALLIAREYPLFGTGPATYAFEDPRHQVNPLSLRAVYTHDDYLNLLDDYGLVGFAIGMFFVFAVTLALASQVEPDSRWTERVLVAAALIAWWALLVHSFLDFNMHIPANATFLFALAGMALSRKSNEDAPYHWSTISLARFGPWVGVALGIFGLIYGAEIARTALTDYPYEAAEDNAEVVPTAQSIQGVERALSFDSGNAQALLLLGDLRRVRAARAENDDERMMEGQAALAAYQKALKANPLDDGIRARLGLTYDLLQRYSEAYLCYQAAVTAQPSNGGFWMALGNHLLNRGLLDKAEEAYATAAICPYDGRNAAAMSAKKLKAILSLNSFLPPETTASSAPAKPTGPEPATVP